MAQLFRDLDFGTGSEDWQRILVGAAIVQFNLEHGGLHPLEETTQRRVTWLFACRVPTMK
jgi:hypothetical protein